MCPAKPMSGSMRNSSSLVTTYGVGLSKGEVVGIRDDDGPGDAASAGTERGKANVAEGDAVGEISGDGLTLGTGVGDGLGVGVGGGGIMFRQRCNGTVAPPISLTSIWQRSNHFSRSGGPNCGSAVLGKMR